MNKFSILSLIGVMLPLTACFNDKPVEQTPQQMPKTTVQQPQTKSKQVTEPTQDESIKIADAFQQRKSDVQVYSKGKVIAILPDDNQGSRHQKFILKLNNGITVLVAHNIDLAPRIQNLRKGDMVEFYGEYEYSDKGGVIHWTHHDPQKRHVGGWLKHEGQTYQ
ncbi:DUF3465 domain-containing protein [Moraxella sp. ZY21109]|nr:DUF3465 domain-containing protein [Moraxella sp. ZY210820]WLF84546.1 DUF3465 domain-containing protein [Moraxella sp. ZY210820]